MSVPYERRDGVCAFSSGAMACAARNVALHHACLVELCVCVMCE